MKILTVVGARPQFIKEAILSEELSKHEDLDEILVHTGQHFDFNMSDVFFNNLGIPQPNYYLGVSGGTHASMTGRIMQAFERVLDHEVPDLVVVYGDTNSTLAGALTAIKKHYPVCHVESGARTGSLSNPEEVNRLCTDHVSSINCAPSKNCFENLMKENLIKGSVFTGDIMLDAFLKYLPLLGENEHNYLDVNGEKIELPHRFFYLTCHREENSTVEPIREILLAMEQLQYPVIYPVHPRMKQVVLETSETYGLLNTHFIQPVGYSESLNLLEKSEIVITDSGGLQREAFFAGKKCVTLLPFPSSDELLLGNRNVILETITQERILNAIQVPQFIDPTIKPFGTGKAARKIVDAIEAFFFERNR